MVETSLQWGRSHAIAANTGLVLIVDSDGKRFYWTDAYTGDRYEGTVRYLPVGIRITSSPRRPLRFYQRGNAVPAGTFVVQGEAGSWRVIVSPSGRIRTQRD
jgi:Tfp pilus assembly protein FimT